MFSGLVSGGSHISELKINQHTIKMTVTTSASFLKDIQTGDSIAINGCCLTVEAFTPTTFTVTMMPQTFKKTSFKNAQVGDAVNVERAILASGRFEGHIVTGHIDDTISLVSRQANENALELILAIPKHLTNQIVSQGSVALNGVSLTVMWAKDNQFAVGLIPHTQAETNLASLQVGDEVNLETDILAKYVASNLKGGPK